MVGKKIKIATVNGEFPGRYYVHHPVSARDKRQQRYEHLTSRQRSDIRRFMDNAERRAKISEFELTRAIANQARKYGTSYATIIKVYTDHVDAKRRKPL